MKNENNKVILKCFVLTLKFNKILCLIKYRKIKGKLLVAKGKKQQMKDAVPAG